MPVTVVSFYTEGYAAGAARLRGHCIALGVPHYIQARDTAGSYLANCRQKPQFIAECLAEVQGPILWIDADGSLLNAPHSLDLSLDFAARPKVSTLLRQQGVRRRQWHVGTLFFGATPAAKALVQLWIAQLRNDEFDSDESALERLWWSEQWPTTLRYGELPQEYFVMRRRSVEPHTVVYHRLSRSADKSATLRRINAFKKSTE